MKFLFTACYSAAIFLYRTGIALASLSHSKAKQWKAGRRGLFEQMQLALKQDEFRAWFHCASVGEFEQGRPVIEAYRKQFPSHKIVLTFFSPSGYELRKNFSGADYIFYLPPDTRRNAKRFLDLMAPRLAVFVKYEFWFHFLSELNRRKIPSLVISAKLRQSQWLFSAWAQPLKEELKAFDRIFVQDDNSLQVLQEHGFANAELAGDTRFDRVFQIAQAPKRLPLIEQFKDGRKLMVAGSTWRPDEKLIAPLKADAGSGWKWVMVPHEISDVHVAELMKLFPDSVLYSEAEAGKPLSSSTLILDGMGLLSSVYQYADIAYIGGGFGSGIHNTLEAAVYGIPVLFGPRFQKFNEAVALIERGGGKAIHDFASLKSAFTFFSEDRNLAAANGNSSWVESKTGATLKIMRRIETIISGNAASLG